MIMDFYFILLFFIFPIIAVYIYNKLFSSVLSPTIPSFLIIALLTLAYVGTISFYFHLDSFSYKIGIDNKEHIMYMLFANIWTISSVILGFIYAKYVLKMGTIESNYANSRQLNLNENIIIFILFLIGITVLYMYLSKVPQIALLVALSDSDESIDMARNLMGNSFGGNWHWYKLYGNQMLVLITFIYFASWLIKKNIFNFTLFFTSFLVSSFAVLSIAKKSQFVWLIIGLLIVYTMIKLKGRINVRYLLISIISIFVFLYITYSLFIPSYEGKLFLILEKILSRISIGLSGAYFIFDYIPKENDFLLGSTFPNPGGILPHTPFNLNVKLFEFVHPEMLELDIVGNKNSVFWMEAYANFGVFGILILPFIVGLIIYFISHVLNRLEKTPIVIGTIVFLMLHYKDISITGISSYVIDIKLFFLVVPLLLAMLMVNLKLHKRKVIV
ncbi:O-antigen polymerase [Sulfurimonas sp.]|uniref:O-antigen polymerase n=1 Tax=Sulfurimonas sp. TaxID=2022749 RepID=UPI00356554E1